MAKYDIRLKALKYRKSGKSIKNISEILGVSKGSVSVWCKDTVLTLAQKKKLHSHMVKMGYLGRLKGAEMNKNKKRELIEAHGLVAKKMLGNISKRDLLVAGISLYWAEGSKKGGKVSFSNSDPKLILLMKKWYVEVLGVTPSGFMPRIFINHVHEARIGRVLSFWSKLLNLPKEQFGKPVLLRVQNKKIYENHDKYYGVMALMVRNPSRYKHKIQGMIDHLSLGSQVNMSE